MPCHPPSDAAAPVRYDSRASLGMQLRRVVTQLVARIERRMEPLGLTDAQWRPLLCLSEGSPVTATDLARRCNLDTGGLTRLVDRLAAKGLCVRERSELDRRVVHVSLTTEGLRVAEQLPAVLCAVQRELLAGFSSEEEAQVRALLRRMECNAAAPDDPLH
ncbi:MarR family winged helix-turn-helix transcriptional regulator [Comamonas flocculans]|uniref:MarR family transcriptional regulator n=1 Tax=Comamonas flocculans TaxID=2597701 RepID=A0A5B8RZ03_9BURK|nr:MarR family transcriptional regulator [Comamonas flocculans]QEA13097.1 MarR family transcriptional regulator [Comamonas flocculans]